ncbi:MAG TPA: phosphotransferase, partial [Solirubrobacter sp.]|nr:phosphotransferase [Solirubrobacter sp.]
AELARLHRAGPATAAQAGAELARLHRVASATAASRHAPPGLHRAAPATATARDAPPGLHRAAPATGLPSAGDPCDGLAAAAEAVGALVPALAPRARALARRVADRLGERTGHPVPVHGDWSADQALLTSAGVVLVDLDRARLDDPAVDVAGWIAAAHVAGEAPADPADAASALLEGHAAAGGPPLHGRIAAPTAAALLRRAVEPFRLRDPDWPDAIERLLATAEHQLRC